MTDFIANDDDGRWDADHAALFGETERRGWEDQGDRWPETGAPNPAAAYRQRTTATASWQRSVLIIAALSAVAWAAVILIVIAALSTL